MSHLKSFFVPKSWTLKKKERVFVVRPRPGAHPTELSVTFSHMIRTLGFASTVREIKQIMKSDGIVVNGKVIHDYKLPVGFLDIVEFKPLGKTFRVLLDNKGHLNYVDCADAKITVAKVIGKSVLKSGKIQLNLSGGRNILSDLECNVGDSISLSEGKPQKVLKLEKGAKIYLVQGRHAGSDGVVQDISNNMIWFKHGEEVLETLKDYAYVIGDLKL